MSAIDYTRVNFQDYPNTSTPITAQNLNKLDKGIYDLDITLTEFFSAHQSYSRNISWYGTSSTAASTIAKTATTSDGKFSLATGAKVSIKFTYDNTASAPTLNVDSTGAKSIKAYGTTTPTIWWKAGDVVTFTYDGTNWIMGATEGQIAQINSGLNNKMPAVTSVSDISNLDTGFYIYYGVGPAHQTSSTYYFVINTKYGTGYITQMLISLQSGLIYTRRQFGGTWGNFQIVPTTNSLASATASSVDIDAFSAVHFDNATGKFFVYIDGVRHDIASY